MADRPGDRQPQRLHAPVGELPSSCATVLSAVEPPGPGPKRIVVKRERLTAGAIRRDVGGAAHRRAGARLAKADPACGSPPPRHLDVAVDPQAADGQ